MLHAQGLRKRYRAREVVRDFSFRLDPGEVVGLLGPNGAGKTTCFYLVVGLVAADAGRIALDDRDITALPMHVRARLGVGYLPQEPSVFRRLTVAENVMAILELREGLTRKARETELARLLEELHVAAIRRAASPGVTRLPGGRHGRPRLLAAVIRRAVRRRCPAPSCLAQALALQRLLEARGFAARLKLGLVPSARPPLGHAWVECDGTPVGGSWRLTRRYISCETS